MAFVKCGASSSLLKSWMEMLVNPLLLSTPTSSCPQAQLQVLQPFGLGLLLTFPDLELWDLS